jgi:hypothetical protein
MTKHTPGPWKYCPPVLDDESGFVGAKAGDGHGVTSLADRPVLESAAQFEANAARIVACVNALDGIEDPEAEIALLRAIQAGAVALVRAVFENGDSVPLAQDLAGLISEDLAEDLLTGLT